MLLYGRKSKVIPGPNLDNIDCQNCENKQFSSFGVLNFFHLYHIPTLLTKKEVGISCTNCKATLIGKEVPENINNQVEPEVFTKAKTLPLYSGLLVLLVVICLGFVYVQHKNAEQASYVAQPMTNDVYIIKVGEIFQEEDPSYPYGSMRLVSQDGENYLFQIGNMVYNKAKGVRKDISSGKAYDNAYYSEELVAFTQEELTGYNESGVIYSISRK